MQCLLVKANLREQAAWLTALGCMLPWHHREHLLADASATAQPFSQQLAWWLGEILVCRGIEWRPGLGCAAVGGGTGCAGLG